MKHVAALIADAAPKLTGPDVQSGGLSPQTIALDAVVFVLGVLILGGILVWIGKRIFIDEKY